MKTAATLGISISAAASVAFTLYAGRRNPSTILIALFIGWVLAPFAGMLWMQKARKRNLLPRLTWIIAPISAAVYGYIALGPPRQRTAFTFLIVPLASWLFIVVRAAMGRRSTGT
ncbi:MAG TPA: hypothetical protein VN519_15240 [Bryobacteraceae bacterium]|nr:hypothetical protein [Bryobacteraceae bacterium]